MMGKRFWIDTLEIGHIYINDNDKHLSWMEVVDLLNNQQERIQDLEKKLKHTTTLNDECQESFAPLVVENKELKKQNNKLQEVLDLISDIDSIVYERDSVKELIRDKIRGLDTVSYEYPTAWNHYVILSKWFKETYKEDWDNE